MGGGRGERAQAIQIGAVILFAFLVLALAGYQAVLVPQGNQAVEFNHLQDVRNDFTEGRDEVVDVYFTGTTRSTSFKLGTRYSARIFGVNPAPVSGQLTTTDVGTVEVRDGSGTDVFDQTCPAGVTPDARLLSYQSNYNYLADSALYADNTVSHLQSDRGGGVVQSGQQFVSGETINLLLLKNGYDRSAVGATSTDFVPGPYRINTVVNPEVTVPTRLSEQAWRDLINSTKYRSISYDDSGDPHSLTVQFDGTFDIACSPVGVGGPPPSGERTDGPIRKPGEGDVTDDINPAGPGAVTLSARDFDEGADEITLTFINNDNTERTFARARVPFYYESKKNSEVTRLELTSNPVDDEFVVGDPFEPVDADISIPPGGSETITLRSPDDMQKNDFFEFDVEFRNGVTNRYFIDTNSGNVTGTTVTSVSASDISRSASETQDLSFSLGQDLSSDETVTIDLSNAQAPNQVNYPDTNDDLTVSGGSGSATFTTSNQGNAIITYTADGSERAGDTVTLTVSSIDATGPRARSESPYTVEFEGPAGGIATDDFSVD